MTDEQVKVFTFKDWLEDTLAEVDPSITLTEDNVNRIDIKIGGDWHIATIYAPPTGLLSAWLDTYPRSLQTEIFRRIIFTINSWCGMETDTHTGLPLSKHTS